MDANARTGKRGSNARTLQAIKGSGRTVETRRIMTASDVIIR